MAFDAWAYPLIISIEGGIGVGKSTQIQKLQELFKDNERIVILPEPVDEWVDKGFLQGMYDGSVTMGEFQHMVLMSLAGDLLKALARKPAPAIIITERSPWGNHHVFARANLTGTALDLYQHTWERVLGGLPSQLDVKYVYLRADPETIEERMKTRGREAEAKVPREYLETLHRLHDEWMEVTPSVTLCGDDNVDDVWRGLCSNLSRWFAEAGETFKAQREIKETSERERNLTVMICSAQEGADALEQELPASRAKRAKIAPAEEA